MAGSSGRTLARTGLSMNAPFRPEGRPKASDGLDGTASPAGIGDRTAIARAQASKKQSQELSRRAEAKKPRKRTRQIVRSLTDQREWTSACSGELFRWFTSGLLDDTTIRSGIYAVLKLLLLLRSGTLACLSIGQYGLSSAVQQIAQLARLTLLSVLMRLFGSTQREALCVGRCSQQNQSSQVRFRRGQSSWVPAR